MHPPHAALGRDSKVRYVFLSTANPGFGAFDRVSVVDKAKEYLSLRMERQVREGRKVRLVRAVDWHGHVNPLQGPRAQLGNQIGELGEFRCVFWLNNVPSIVVAITQM